MKKLNIQSTPNTDLVITKVGDKIELHFRGDVTFVNFIDGAQALQEMLDRGVDLVACSTAFTKPTPFTREEMEAESRNHPGGKLTVSGPLVKELDRLQKEWAAMGPVMRKEVEDRMRKFIEDGKITKTPLDDEDGVYPKNPPSDG